MQLRRSPGGSMLKSLRSRPEEPPSSVTVTTAARSAMALVAAGRSPGAETCRRSPRSSVDRPVPPPMATTRKRTRQTASVACSVLRRLRRFDRLQESLSSKQALRNLRIQQLGKARIVRHVLEVVVDARLQPVLGVQFDGPRQIGKAVLGVAGDRFQHRQPVKSVVGARVIVAESGSNCSRASS